MLVREGEKWHFRRKGRRVSQVLLLLLPPDTVAARSRHTGAVRGNPTLITYPWHSFLTDLSLVLEVIKCDDRLKSGAPVATGGGERAFPAVIKRVLAG